MLRFLTAGESHGPSLTAIIDGLPAGLALDEGVIQADLARRQTGLGSSDRQQIERDRARITGGVLRGRTTGAPVVLVVENRDWLNWHGREVAALTAPRPGHADLVGAVKYGYRDLRPAAERASARETAARVAAGAVCRRLLGELDVQAGSYVVRIGSTAFEPAPDMPYPERFRLAEASDVRCPDAAVSEAMRSAIRDAAAEGDSLGGVFEVVALGVPAGLGSFAQWDRRLDARLLGAVGSIPGVKGAEIGPAWVNSSRKGSEVHDEIVAEGRTLRRPTNRAGGLEGGVSNGQPLVLRAAVKPPATLRRPLRSVDLVTGQEAGADPQRSDVCFVPRAAVVGEAMAAWVLADAFLEKLGGDTLDELRARLAELRRLTLDDLEMDGVAWHFG